MWTLLAFVCGATLALPPGALLAQTPRADAGRLTQEQAEALVREVSAEVEALRQLRFKRPVAVEIVDGTAAREDFASGIDDEAREGARHIRDAWVHLGLIPRGTDLVAAQLDSAEDEVLGYYEAGSDTFHLLSHVGEEEIRPVMAHELTHALEDQHHDLEALQRSATNEDHAVAIKAVIEGSAMVTTLSILSRQGGIAAAQKEAVRVSRARTERVKRKGVPTFVERRLVLYWARE